MQFFFRISNNNLVFIIKYNFIFILELTFQRSDIEFLDIEGVPELPAICTPGRTKGRKRVISSSQYTCARARIYTYTQREEGFTWESGSYRFNSPGKLAQGKPFGKGTFDTKVPASLPLFECLSAWKRKKKNSPFFPSRGYAYLSNTHIVFISWKGKAAFIRTL